MKRSWGWWLLLVVLGAVYAQGTPSDITPGGSVLLDGRPLAGVTFLRRGRGVLLPLEGIAAALGAHLQVADSRRQVIWDGQPHAIEAVVVNGILYVPWWTLKGLCPQVDFGLTSDKVVLQRKPVPMPTGVQTAAASPAPPPSSGLTDSAVLAELNRARTHPQEYVQTLQAVRAQFTGTLRTVPGGGKLQTQEGVAAVDEAIAYVQHQTALDALAGCKGLTLAAQDYVKSAGPAGVFGHLGPDGSLPADRVSRYGTWSVSTGENIAYGIPDASEIVSDLIIDDGIADRGHRTNVFKVSYRLVGIAFGPHATYGIMCVMDFAGEYQDRP